MSMANGWPFRTINLPWLSPAPFCGLMRVLLYQFFCGFFLHCLTKFDVQNGLGQIKWTQWYSFLKPSQLPRNFVVIEMLRSLVERTGFAGSVKQMMFHLGPSRVGPPVNLALLIVFEE